ncbi:MAG TPA: universal stress protein [Chitinophagaceae bacterium]
MTTFLALVDFSDAAFNAVSFAAEISKRSSAHLVIVNIVQRGKSEDETKIKLEPIKTDLKKSFDLKCEAFIAHGNLITALKKIIAVQHPDIIVMGTKGASGLKKVLIGSNTVNVISKIKVPVLVIPEVARFQNFFNRDKNRIVLATDLDLFENDDAINILKEIALLIIEPKVRVLSVRPKNTELPNLKRMERDALISIFKPEIESERVTIFSNSVIGGINFYLTLNKDTGLIVMIARDSGHLFKKHYTREMASHTHLPLLVLYDTKI